jgi:hypothetical protein
VLGAVVLCPLYSPDNQVISLFRANAMRIAVLPLAGLALLVAPLAVVAEQLSRPPDAIPSASGARSCGESFSRSPTAEFNRQCVALAGPFAAMRGDTLVIRMDDGRRKIFDNKNSSGASAGAFGYGLADFYPATHIFVVCDYGPDSGESKAIYGKTGREIDFGSSFPQFSPDGNWVLTIDYGEDEADSSFTILDVRDNKEITVWKSETNKTRLPPFVAWTNDDTIKFASRDEKEAAVLSRGAGGAWSLRKIP